MNQDQRTGLLLIDPLNDFISKGGKLWPLIKETAEEVGLLPNLGELQRCARAAGIRIFFAPHHRGGPRDYDGWKFLNPTHRGAQSLRPFERDSWGAQFHPDFAPRPEDIVTGEHWMHDGFSKTDLDYQLRNRGIDRIIIAGLRANACVEATARQAVELGYHVTLVKDASAAFNREAMRATFEINAPGFAHEIATTAELTRRMLAAS